MTLLHLLCTFWSNIHYLPRKRILEHTVYKGNPVQRSFESEIYFSTPPNYPNNPAPVLALHVDDLSWSSCYIVLILSMTIRRYCDLHNVWDEDRSIIEMPLYCSICNKKYTLLDFSKGHFYTFWFLHIEIRAVFIHNHSISRHRIFWGKSIFCKWK